MLVKTLKKRKIMEQGPRGNKREWHPEREASDWKRVKGRKGVGKKIPPFLRKS